MIKFSPDCRCLHSLVLKPATCHHFLVDVNMENDDNFSLDVLRSEESYYPCEFESCSEPGFLLGDPFYLPSEGDIIAPRKVSLAFVLTEKSILTVRRGQSVIEMLQLDELTKDTAGRSETTERKVALSLSGDTLYVITTTEGSPATLMAWDITSSMFKPGKKVFEHTGGFNKYNLVAVREGVLLQTSHNTLELWNVELSECIRSWADLEYITEVTPISEERVAFEVLSSPPSLSKAFRKLGRERESKVIILDTAREGSVSTIAFDGYFVGCNSKRHVISAAHGELHMKCDDKVLWKISQPVGYIYPRCKAFSPTEQYFVFANGVILVDTINFYVLDVDSGKTLRPLQLRTPYPNPLSFGFLDCKFVSDEECITSFSNPSSGDFFQLFNVKSGDLLSEIARNSALCSLAACPRKRLIAIGFMDSKVNFKVLQVKLPGDKHSRGRKRSGFINKEQSYNTDRKSVV